MLAPWKKPDTCVGIGAPAVTTRGIRVMREKARLHVSVLGKLAVVRDCTPMMLPVSKKTRALLAYLAVTARPHSRDRLCEVKQRSVRCLSTTRVCHCTYAAATRAKRQPDAGIEVVAFGRSAMIAAAITLATALRRIGSV